MVLALAVALVLLPACPAFASGGSDSPGATMLSTNWYFAEGTTRAGFITYVAVMNSNDSDATVNVDYLLGDGSTVGKSYTVKAHSRYTIDLLEQVGAGKDAGAHFESTLPVAVERPMYFKYENAWTGGSDSLGATVLSGSWYFAEGTTRTNFVTYLAISNPGNADAECTFDYMLADGTTVTKKHTVLARSRYTLDVSKDVGAGKDVSTHITCAQPVVAERPMYFNYEGTWDGGHDAMGVGAPATNWFFAEGTTRHGYATYLAVQNPGAEDSECVFGYMLGDGTTVEKTHTVKAHSRYTINVADDVGPEKDVSTHLLSQRGVIAERPMYFGQAVFTVCVDAGHSNHTGSEVDPATGLNVGDNEGAPGELENNWALAQKVKADLERDGFVVKMTKSKASEYVNLRQRADIGNTCDVMVRLHYDDSGFTGVMRPPVNGARCPVSNPSRITVVDGAVASKSDAMARVLASTLGLQVRDDTGGTTAGNATPSGHPTCLIGSCLSRVPIVTIENKMSLVRDNPTGQDQVAAQVAAGVEKYLNSTR